MSAAEHVQNPDQGVRVTLYEIDCMNIFGQILRFTPAPLVPSQADPVPQPLAWRGEVYNPRACQSTGWQWDGLGPFPTPKLTLGNTDNAISALCIAYKDLLGATVTRHRTWMKYLDDQPEADPDVELDPDVFRIEQKTTQNKLIVEFQLATAVDLRGRLIPGRQVLQGYCSFRQRFWNGTEFVYSTSSAACPWTGTSDLDPGPYFDAAGNSVPTPEQDKFSKRLTTCCKKRFPTGAVPFGGFPGAARYRG